MPVLGIDIGTQSLKVVVLGEADQVVSAAKIGYAHDTPNPGWAEQQAPVWLGALRPAIADALARSGLSAGQVDAIGVCGQLDGCLATDHDCEPLTPALIWMDRRAEDETRLADADMVFAKCGLVRDATHMGAKIAWLDRHMNRREDVAIWHQPVSFVVARLTGRAVMSHSLASTTMLYDIEARDWDEGLLAAFGVEQHHLTELDEEAALAGRLTAAGAGLTGLLEGTPVAVGTGDDFSNLIGAGVTMPGTVAVSLGTAETVAALATIPVRDPQQLVETHAFAGGLYHVGNPGWLSGGAVKWARSLIGTASDDALSALAASAPAGCDGLTFIPALSGAMAPKWIASARACFIGMAATHTRAHIARAVLEGTAFAMKDVVERLISMGIPTERLRLMGGGTRSDLWCQIRADLSGRPTETMPPADASAIGAALLASVAIGLEPDIGIASARLDRKCRLFEPNAEAAGDYQRAYSLYQERFAALEPIWSVIPSAT